MANLYGVDKVPFDARVTFTERNIDNIFDSADDPMGGKMWWLKADDPWQCLACCFEYSLLYLL